MAQVFFLMCKASLFILLCVGVNGLRKILCFFNMIFNYFFDDLIIIEDQFILISYEKMGLKEKESK
jgi:hypothetical protein